MNIAVTVVRGDKTSALADAFLLPDGGADRLGAVIAAVSGSSVPALFRVHGAWLVVPATASGFTSPALVRLRRVADHFYVPVDGTLSPAILPDEFPGLQRGAGIVQLASGCFAFDPKFPVPVVNWLRLPPRGAGSWRPFPTLPASPDALRKIERPAPPAAVVEVLQGGEPDGRDPLPTAGEPGSIADADRPPSASFLLRVGATGVLGVAAVAAWIGQNLGLGGLARLGANLAKQAIESVPRLSEKIVGEQEAALRELLRQLKSGDVEKALKRAPIAVADPNQPGKVSGDSRLSERDTRYSFGELFRSNGVASAWVGGGDVWYHLQAEYRKLAEEAIQRGDYRRAAYLLGVLLRDLRGAANVLKTGGRYRDAALLFRDRLNDPLAAAAAFELAGDYDEAVRLYERHGDDVKAAELLRRIGDENRAVGFFLQAAKKLGEGREHLKAGDLVRTKLGDSDLARGYYRSGWDTGHTDALACGERLIDDALVKGDWDQFDSLLDSATVRFGPPSHTDAGRFFNYVLKVAPGFVAQDREADVRDRVRLHFAEHLRETATDRVISRVEVLFGGPTPAWSPGVRRDAAYATKAALTPNARAIQPKPAIQGPVRAVVYAKGGGIVFIGTDEGVTAWNLKTNATSLVTRTGTNELVALCTDRTGQTLYTLCDRSALRLTAYTTHLNTGRKAEILATADIEYGDLDTLYFQPQCFDEPKSNYVVLACDGNQTPYHAQMLIAGSAQPFHNDSDETFWIGEAAGLLWDWSDGVLAGWRRGTSQKSSDPWLHAKSVRPGWIPTHGVGCQRKLDWAALDVSTLVLAGIDAAGVLHCSKVPVTGSTVEELTCRSARHSEGYAAVTILRANSLAAVTKTNQVQLLRSGGDHLVVHGKTLQLDSAASVAFISHYPPTHELLVVFDDGTTSRIPVPTQTRSA